jgi:rare lipoprotein A
MKRPPFLLLAPYSLLLTLLVLGACSSTATAPVTERGTVTTPVASIAKAAPRPADSGYTLKRGGGYYKDDGPGDNPPENIEAIPDAVPRAEPLHRFANRPYSVLGRNYTPMREIGRYKVRGIASWYGKKFHGQKTSTGEIYDMYGMTAAHPTLPLPSYVRVTSLVTGRSVVLRVNDRGPFHADRIIDLSYSAASRLGLVGGGSGMVEVESLVPGMPLPEPQPELLANAGEAAPKSGGNEQRVLPEIDDASGAWLQLGAFGNRDNAEALKSRLARELGDLGEKLVVRVSGNLFRVHLGPWADGQAARGVADQLAERLQLKAVVIVK